MTASVAAAARSADVPRFALVTAVNADADSFMLYPQVKVRAVSFEVWELVGTPAFSIAQGWTERSVASMGFPSLSIYRPAMLLSERQESRFFEELFMPVAQWLEKLMPGKIAIPVGAFCIAAFFIHRDTVTVLGALDRSRM